jgi:formylglycine-generating enzyme required for sulfatase activity
MKARNIVVAVVVLAVAGAAMSQTHAPWPTDWNNWSDPALWVTVGNPGNVGEASGWGTGQGGPERICGSVAYAYNIGKYEVTAGQYMVFLNAVGGVDTYALYNMDMTRADWGGCGITRSGGGTEGDPYTYAVPPDLANRPVNYVSWGDAARFANWLTNGKPKGVQGPGTTEAGVYSLNGAITDADLLSVAVPGAEQRGEWSSGAKPYFLLTSEDEWYKAAYYDRDTSSYFDYSTSSDTAPGSDMGDASGNNANHKGASTYPIDSGKYTTVAGEFQNSDSPYGTFDQGGNVWEWNEAVIGSYRGLRGGGFGNSDLILSASFRYSDIYFCQPANEDPGVGFRVSVVPEPATLSLLALLALSLPKRGGLAMIRRRRKK